ncbi:MAG: helix-turn-helix transcriptional regulator, partial [Treponema sp.]|nr:helix-turn-helix transcriptional regulator [Treponema sp.]
QSLLKAVVLRVDTGLHKSAVNSTKHNLRILLEYEDMTVKELAFKTGISKRSIENYLNARASMPPADYACKIASALNTTVEALVYGSETPVPSAEDIKILDLLKQVSVADKSAFLHLMESITK